MSGSAGARATATALLKSACRGRQSYLLAPTQTLAAGSHFATPAIPAGPARYPVYLFAPGVRTADSPGRPDQGTEGGAMCSADGIPDTPDTRPTPAWTIERPDGSVSRLVAIKPLLHSEDDVTVFYSLELAR